MNKLAICFLILFSSSGQAALLARDLNGDYIADAYYDDLQDITWLANANSNQMLWADALSYAETANTNSLFGLSSWRLPTTLTLDCTWGTGYSTLYGIGYGCYGSEMGFLSNTYDINTYTPGPFQNLRDFHYWSSTEYSEMSAFVYTFYTNHPSDETFQDEAQKDRYLLYAWLVTDGDVGASKPLPTIFSSFRIVGLGVIRRRNKSMGKF